MSLVFTETPVDFQPVLSDGIFFVLSADTTNTFKFRYVYNLYVEGDLVFEGKCTPNPYGLGIVDLQQVLETYCANNPISYWGTTPIYTHQTFPFSRPSQDEVINYQLVAGYEYSSSPEDSITGFTGIGNAIGSPAYNSNVYKVFRSTMGTNGRATQQDFDFGPYVLSGSPTTTNPTLTGLFLTNSPRVRNIAPNEWYTLAFTNYYLSQNYSSPLSEPYYVKYTFYDDTGAIITATTYENITTNGGGPRTSCDQVYQSLYLIDPPTDTDYNTLYVGAGTANLPDLPSNCAYYDVQLYGLFEGETTPIQPTPTPTPSSTPNAVTPTPTPTPSSTPVCSNCNTYDIIYTGDSESLGTATIINCTNGLSQNLKLTAGVFYSVCSCGAPFTGADVVATEVGSCIPAASPSPTPTSTLTPTPSASVATYTLLGRTTPDEDTGAGACSAYLTARGYTALKPLASLIVGDVIYDTYPSTPTNGNDLWVALKTGGAGTARAFQINSIGEILDTYNC